MFTHAYTSCCSELLSDFEGDTDTVLDPLPTVLRWVAWVTEDCGTQIQKEPRNGLGFCSGPVDPSHLSTCQTDSRAEWGGAGGWGGQGEGVAYIVKPGR